MAMNSISNSTQSGVSNNIKSNDIKKTSKTVVMEKVKTNPHKEAAVYEPSGQVMRNDKSTYTKDSVKLNEVSKQVNAKLSYLRGIVENLFTMQGLKTAGNKGIDYDAIIKKYDGNLKAFYQNLVVDDSTRLNAQNEISENGFWGVKQTSQRAIEFAKALSGGDSSKGALLRDAIIKGYEAAEKAWGGELPEICKQTKEATLKGLDDLAN